MGAVKVSTIPVDLLLEVRVKPGQTQTWKLGGLEGLLEGSTPSVRGLKLGRLGGAGFPPDQSRFPSL